mmetsp:Transcript_19558/g.40182  ORF Transcript_19558/g.40182 Transcript_19558/m.40182 type:complete len:215 (+) Transcript_19558:5191-5835(+)
MILFRRLLGGTYTWFSIDIFERRSCLCCFVIVPTSELTNEVFPSFLSGSTCSFPAAGSVKEIFRWTPDRVWDVLLDISDSEAGRRDEELRDKSPDEELTWLANLAFIMDGFVWTTGLNGSFSALLRLLRWGSPLSQDSSAKLILPLFANLDGRSALPSDPLLLSGNLPMAADNASLELLNRGVDDASASAREGGDCCFPKRLAFIRAIVDVVTA